MRLFMAGLESLIEASTEAAKESTGLHHNSTLADPDPSWGSVDKTKLPRIAFADMGEKDKKSTWKYPHHIERGGKLYLSRHGLNAAWAASQGAHTGKKASPAVISHLSKHRKAIGADKD